MDTFGVVLIFLLVGVKDLLKIVSSIYNLIKRQYEKYKKVTFDYRLSVSKFKKLE